jgi:hypothetical protein
MATTFRACAALACVYALVGGLRRRRWFHLRGGRLFRRELRGCRADADAWELECVDNSHCGTGLRCLEFECVPPGQTGDRCRYNSDCESGNCGYGAGNPPHCMAAADSACDGDNCGLCVETPLGTQCQQACSSDADCPTDQYCWSLSGSGFYCRRGCLGTDCPAGFYCRDAHSSTSFAYLCFPERPRHRQS